MTSGTLDVFEPMTAAPHCIASRTGSPNPSYSDGKQKTAHRLYNARRSSSLTNPVVTTDPRDKPHLRARVLQIFDVASLRCADERELVRVPDFDRELGEGFDGTLHVLSTLEAPGIQNERPVQLIAAPQLGDACVRQRELAKEWARRRGDIGDAVGGQTKQIDPVLARRLRDRQPLACAAQSAQLPIVPTSDFLDSPNTSAGEPVV